VFQDEWESILERMAPTVYRNALAHGEVGVYNAITEDWARLDLTVIISLFLETAAVEDRGGVLKLNPLLSEQQREILESLPPLIASREAVFEVHRRIAEAFLPAARVLHERLGLDWPDAFERATLTYLEGQLGLRIEPQHRNS
jgi:hypothetical protein